MTHWSARFMATELGISFASVARVWREWRKLAVISLPSGRAGDHRAGAAAADPA